MSNNQLTKINITMENNFETRYVFARIEQCAAELSSTPKEIADLFLKTIGEQMLGSGETTMLGGLVREYIASSIESASDIHDMLLKLGVSDYSLLFREKKEMLRFSSAKESSDENNLTLSFVPGIKEIHTIESTSVIRIVIPDSVEEIQYCAFMRTRVQDLVFPPHIKEIDPYVCCQCSELKTVVLPEGLNKIGKFAFGNCHSLKEINIPSTLTSINDCAFEGCDSLPEETRRKIIAIGGEAAFGKDKITREKQGDDN